MKDYFKLQYKRLSRNFSYLDIPLWVKLLLLMVIFGIFSHFLFLKTTFAPHLLLLIALSLLSKMSDAPRNEFIQSLYRTREYRLLRIIENLLVSLPFWAYLLYKSEFWFVFGLLLMSGTMAFVKLNTPSHIVIPTPFGKKPFEFVIGFRNTFFLYPLAYFLTIMAVLEGNPGLGIFSLIAIALLCFNHYSKPEDDYFVWIFKRSRKDFLLEKIKDGILNLSLLTLPVIILLSFFFFQNILLLVGIYALSCIYLGTFVLAKYAAYPNQMNISQGIYLALAMLFPPLLVVLIPLLYSKSLQNLQTLLHDQH